MTAARRGFLAAGVALLAIGAARIPRVSAEGQGPTSFALVLGTAQDGGLPQLGGNADQDLAARQDPKRRRLVTSLLVVDPGSEERFLIDATPDIREQAEIADRVAPQAAKAAGRPPLFQAIALTHAHIGHYAGLMHLGREAYGASGQRVLASDRMARFLETNGPWDLLVKLNHIAIERFTADRPVALNTRLSITPIAVPHRDEYSDTYGFVVRGPTRSLLWLPDIDKWEKWDRRIEDVIAGVDVAYVDGTFFDATELPGRAMSEVPHPFIAESLARFASLPEKQRRKIVFVHLNHTNPAATPGSKAEQEIVKAGMRVASEGERQPL
ncbi:MAG: MBL fold metallo-hydrolase [Vicinamibacteria bacterium]|nr:MBL fold metallo-hydrolase [Vicinamibacteria bacterium]